MALQLLEGFDHWGDIYERFSLGSATYTALDSSVTRLGSGQSIKMWNSAAGLYIPIPSPASELFFGFALYKNIVPSINNTWINIVGNAGAHFSLRLTAWSFAIYNYNGYTLTDSGASSAPLNLNIWEYYEVRVKVSASTSVGDVEVRRNGQTVWQCSAGLDIYNTNNSSANIENIHLYPPGTNNQVSSAMHYDDIYICDTTGTLNNTWLGDVAVDTLYPNANGTTSDFDGSDGNSVDNYLLVDDAQQTGDTDYVQSSTVDDIDLYNFDSIIAGVTVLGVSVSACVRKDDAGSRQGRLLCRSGGTNYEGSAFSPGTDYATENYLWETDPNTSSAWTETGINGAEFGITVEA